MSVIPICGRDPATEARALLNCVLRDGDIVGIDDAGRRSCISGQSGSWIIHLRDREARNRAPSSADHVGGHRVQIVGGLYLFAREKATAAYAQFAWRLAAPASATRRPNRHDPDRDGARPSAGHHRPGRPPAARTACQVAVVSRGLVRTHRWRRIESGQAKSITDLAQQEGVTDAYVCRLLPLTCLGARHYGSDPRWAAAEGAEAGGGVGERANGVGGAASEVGLGVFGNRNPVGRLILKVSELKPPR
jgi:hypothetical protein